METKQSKNYKELKKLALGEGISLFGTCDIATIKKQFLIPEEVLKKLPSAVSIGYRLSDGRNSLERSRTVKSRALPGSAGMEGTILS